MSFVTVYFRQYGKTFGCFAVTILLEISREDIANRILQILLLHATKLKGQKYVLIDSSQFRNSQFNADF